MKGGGHGPRTHMQEELDFLKASAQYWEFRHNLAQKQIHKLQKQIETLKQAQEKRDEA